MDLIIVLSVNGLAAGMLIFLVAVGLTLILGLMGVLNFAHGGLFAWGAYMGLWFFTASGSFIIGIVGAILVGLVSGYLMGKFILEPVHGKPLQQLLITMGMMIVLGELLKAVFTPNPQRSYPPALLAGSFEVGEVVFIKYRLFIIMVGFIIFFAMHYLVKKTKTGLIVRAGVINKEVVQALGININRVFLYVFVFGSGLAVLSGSMLGPYFGVLTPDVGIQFQMLAFLVVAIGGMGSVKGTAVASIIVGLANAYVAYFVPSLETIVSMFIMVVVFIVRPQGLYGAGG